MKYIIGATLLLLLVGCGGEKLQSNTTTVDGSQQNDIQYIHDDQMLAKVNAENYEKISTGMSLEAVQALLGTGQSVAETQSGDIKIQVFKWGMGQKQININFLNGGVKAKAQVGLY